MMEEHRGPAGRGARVALWAGPLAALACLLFLDLDPERPAVTRTAAVALWMAIWWIGEAVPLAVTALLPTALFPMLAILDGRATAKFYFNHILLIFIGGFLVAHAMQRWDLHRRIALATIRLFGTRPKGLLAGFLVTTAGLSMWISNTAGTMMMVPIALAVVLELERSHDLDRRPAVGLLLAVPFGANLGGIATLVGSPTNLTLVRVLELSFPDAPEITFARWMMYGLPVSVALLVLAWCVLVGLFLRGCDASLDPAHLAAERRALGPMSFEEKVVLTDFLALAVLWMTRAGVTVGDVSVPGWASLFEQPEWVTDGAVAILLSVPLFAIPSRRAAGERLLEGDSLRALPWEILVLFGGGFALAGGFQASGLSEWVGSQLSAVGELPPFLVVVCVAVLVTFLTEMTSNMTTAEMLLPLLAGIAVGADIHPLLLMVPASLSCSLAFMLPVATPPNAVAFGTGRIRIPEMVRAGIWMNLIGAVVVSLVTWYLGRAVFGIEGATLPEWGRG